LIYFIPAVDHESDYKKLICVSELSDGLRNTFVKVKVTLFDQRCVDFINFPEGLALGQARPKNIDAHSQIDLCYLYYRIAVKTNPDRQREAQ